MITDFNAIKAEKDRELYVELRNVLDDLFITGIFAHDDKDHLFSECAHIVDLKEILKNNFPKELKEECNRGLKEIEVIDSWIEHNRNEVLMHMISLIQLKEEYDKRKQ